MTKEKRLELYKLALKDYQKSAYRHCWGKCFSLLTSLGFCHYFTNKHGINVYQGKFSRYFPELNRQRLIKRGDYHYESYGGASKQGITDRITALKQAIKEIEDGRN